VADTGNHRVVLLRHDGYRLTWVKILGGAGSGVGQFNGPQGVAFDSRGDLYVTDTGNHRVQVRNLQGAWKALPIQGLENPTGLAVIDHGDPWTFYTTGPYADRLAVIDRNGTRLQTFTLEGKLLASTNALQAADPPVHLKACAFDYYGHLVVTDLEKGALRKYDRDLKPLAVFGESGEGDYHFKEPRGICLSKQLGQMVVAEEESVQYMWVGADALNLRAENGGGAVTFHFYLTEPAYLTADVRGDGDVRVARIADNVQMDERERAIVWTPAPNQPPGPYRLELSVMATYSSRERLAKLENLPFTLVKTASDVPAVHKTPAAIWTSRSSVISVTVGSPIPSEVLITPTPGARSLGEALRAAQNVESVDASPTATATPLRTLGQAIEAVRVVQTAIPVDATPTPTQLIP
jgi:hypothetical protein